MSISSATPQPQPQPQPQQQPPPPRKLLTQMAGTNHQPPCLFYIHGPEGGGLTDKYTIIRIAPENDRAPEFHEMDIPEPFQGQQVLSSFDNGRCCIVGAGDGTAQIVDPFSQPDRWTSLGFLPCLSQKVATDCDFKVAVAIVGAFSRHLVYMMMSHQEDGWIKLTTQERNMSFADLIFSSKQDDDNQNRRFYALTFRADKVLSLDFKEEGEVDIEDVTFDLIPTYVPDYSQEYYDRWCCFHDARLVDAPSGIFMVRWRMLLRRTAQDRKKMLKKREIDVYKLSLPKRKWEQAYSLDGCSFFLGYNQSIAVSTADFPELPSNRIYLPHDGAFPFDFGFSDDEDEEEVEANLIYDLKAQSWTRCHGLDTQQQFTVWMMPPRDLVRAIDRAE